MTSRQPQWSPVSSAGSGGVRRHGSHSCNLLVTQSAALQESAVYCSICVAGIAPVRPGNSQEVWFCPSCKVHLCQKCSSVDESHFPQPLIAMRNPGLSSDAPAAVRTRPKTSAHVLAPLVQGVLCEVICSTTSDEDNLVYCRQKFGGWVRSDELVVLAPTDNAVFNAVVRQHLQHELHGGADLLPDAVLTSAVEQTISLLHSNPPFGLHLASVVLLSLQLEVTAKRSASAIPRAVQMIALTAGCAIEELQRLNQRAAFSGPAVILPAILGRCSAVLWWMMQSSSPARSQGIDLVLPAIASALGALLLAFAAVETKTTARLKQGEEMIALWHTVGTENLSAPGLQLVAAQVTLAALYSTTMLLAFAAPEPLLCRAMTYVAQASNRSAIIALDVVPMWAQVATDRLQTCLQQNTDERRFAVQADWLHADAVELAIRMVKEQESTAAQGCRLIACLVAGNVGAAARLRAITGPFLFNVLHQARSPTVVNAALEAVVAHLTTTHDAAADVEHASDGPCTCTTPHRRHLVRGFTTAAGPAALCERCLSHREESWTETPAPPWVGRQAPLVCQCPRCHPGTLQPPGDEAASLLECSAIARDWRRRLLTILLGKLRVYRHEVVNCVARAALHLALFCNDDLTLEVFWCIANTPLAVLQSCYAEALLFLSRVVRVDGPLGDPMRRTQGSALTLYLTRVVEYQGQQQLPITPQQKASNSLVGSAHADPMGLTPSPNVPTASKPLSPAKPIGDFNEGSVPAELFPPLSPRKPSGDYFDTARAITPPRRARTASQRQV